MSSDTPSSSEVRMNLQRHEKLKWWKQIEFRDICIVFRVDKISGDSVDMTFYPLSRGKNWAGKS